MMRLLPGACLRETALSVAGALVYLVSRRPGVSSGPSNRLAQFIALCIVSGAALLLAAPSVLATVVLGLPAHADDIVLIGLGFVVAAQAWHSPNPRWAFLGVVYAGLLIFAVPLTVVRILA